MGNVPAFVLLIALCTGCASAEGHRLIDDWREARADGEIDEMDMRVLDKDVEALDDALRAPPIPHTGIPWLDLIAPIVTAGVAGVGAHKYTMKKRDKSRAKVLEGKVA